MRTIVHSQISTSSSEVVDDAVVVTVVKVVEAVTEAVTVIVVPAVSVVTEVADVDAFKMSSVGMRTGSHRSSRMTRGMAVVVDVVVVIVTEVTAAIAASAADAESVAFKMAVRDRAVSDSHVSRWL